MEVGRALRTKVRGQISTSIVMFFFLGVLICVWFQIRVGEYQVIGATVEDALAMSNLASAVIDVGVYGKTHEIKIVEEEAFPRFEEALRGNLNLDEDREYRGKLELVGKVEIAAYQIYQVSGSNVECLGFDEEGRLVSRTLGALGSIYTPDGILVESATIYSKVNFEVKGWGDGIICGTKEKSVDIVRMDE